MKGATFLNRTPDSEYIVKFEFPEFTSLCPKTGQPDFATIRVVYVPKANCLESKSVKMYFFAYRSFRGFMESITNKILRDFVQSCNPKEMKVIADFAPRGALKIKVEASYMEGVGYKVNCDKTEAL